MTIKTQGIGPLGQSVQQHNGEPLAAVLADQATTLTASGTQNLEFRRCLADTTSGSITITLKPLADWPTFVPYYFQKVAAGNTLTIDGADSETIEGNATIAVTANNTVIALYSDGAALRRYVEGGSAGGVAGALLAANNLSDLASAGTAQTNLGGTTVGKAVFTAASAAAGRTALSAMAADLSNAAGVTLTNYADDAAAAVGGVAVGGLYRTGSAIMVRVA